MTLKDVASDIVAALNGQTLGSLALTSGANLFADFVYPFPTFSVHVLSQGGPAPEPYLHPTATSMFHPRVQVLVYGEVGNTGHDAAEAVARAIMGYLHQKTVSGYVSLLAQQSCPLQSIEPDTGRNLFTMDFNARYIA